MIRRGLVRWLGFGLVAVCVSDDLRGSIPEADPDSETALLVVSRVGSGRGRVTSLPRGISCGADCGEAYPTGATVMLKAYALEGSTFTGWTGPCWGLDPCTVTMSWDTNVTALFVGRFSPADPPDLVVSAMD